MEHVEDFDESGLDLLYMLYELRETSNNPLVGYAYFDDEDANVLDETGTLFLYFGAFDTESDAASIAVGHRVVDALRSVGLEPEWNGDLRQRICIRL